MSQQDQLSAAVQVQALACLPRASLHVHLEGALRWSTVRTWHPDGQRLPAAPPWLRLADPFPDFDDFLQVFQDQVRPATGSVEAITQHSAHVVSDLASQGVVYVDLIISVPFHRAAGLDQLQVLRAIEAGVTQGQEGRDIDVRLIYGLNRHRPLPEVEAEFEEALALVGGGPDGLIAGIDLQGDERVGRAANWAPLFERARRAGLRLRAHAGELCGPDSVREVLDALGVQHLAHGVRAVEDPALLRRLVDEGIYLHVCPSSNLLLHVAADRDHHPLRRLLEAGCRVSVDADDPLLFGQNIAAEYRSLIELSGLSMAAVGDIARTSLEASLLPVEEQRRHLDCIDTLLSA